MHRLTLEKYSYDIVYQRRKSYEEDWNWIIDNKQAILIFTKDAFEWAITNEKH